MNIIRQNIYLGDKHDARLLPILRTSVTAILNVASEVPVEKHRGIESIKVGMKDSAEDVKILGPTAVKTLHSLLNAGHIVLVHCKQGRSRSPHIVATCIAEREGKSYAEVYEEIRFLRPKVISYSIGQEILEKYGSK